jgi:thioredoxin 1
MKTLGILLVLFLTAGVAPAGSTEATNAPAGVATNTPAKLPRLVDLGANKCIPCKMMAPILEELKKEYAGKLQVEFIDVWRNPEAGKPYEVEVIPTQIFFDASGKERFRHVGFYSKEDILKKWEELGVVLAKP